MSPARSQSTTALGVSRRVFSSIPKDGSPTNTSAASAQPPSSPSSKKPHKASSAPKKEKATTRRFDEDDEAAHPICYIRPRGPIRSSPPRRNRARPRRPNPRRRHRAALRRLSKSFDRRLAFGNGPADARHRTRAAAGG